MTWQQAGVVLASIALLGAAVTALPPIWRLFCKIVGGLWVFLRTAAKAPIVLDRMYTEFAPNHGGSMRDAIDGLTVDTKHLRESNHKIAGTVTVAVGSLAAVTQSVDDHTRDDAASFAVILGRLNRIDRTLNAVQRLDAEVKHDLTQYNEIDELGREGRIERRRQLHEELAGRIEQIHAELRTMNDLTVGQMADAAETRRIESIPVEDRTSGEQEHLDAMGDDR